VRSLDTALTRIRARDQATLFIDGTWRASSGDVRLSVVAPHNEAVLLTYTEPAIADVDAAVAAARTAFDKGPWPRFSPAERGSLLARVADLLRARLPELAEAWTGQVGAPIAFTEKASGQAPGLFDYYGALIGDYPIVEERRRSSGGIVRVVKEPAGVMAAISPWNAPLVLLCYKVAAGLAAGCTIVAKPSPETPIEAYILAECLAEAGLPPGVFNLLPAGREIGDHLVRHPGIDKVSFTGSTAAGKHIARVCADRLARVSLELGGKSAAILLEDADVAQALGSLVPYSMPITGQVCFSLTRVLVPRARAAEMLDAYSAAVAKLRVGDPFDRATNLGPLAMPRQRERVRGYISRGVEEGARLVMGGGCPAGLDRGYFVEPTVFADVTPDMTIAREEIFGPVVSFIVYDDEADMIAKANATNYGLHGAVYTADVEHGYRVARAMRSGSVTVNGMIVDIEMPFGGFKESGQGREGGIEGLENYLETKAIYFA